MTEVFFCFGAWLLASICSLAIGTALLRKKKQPNVSETWTLRFEAMDKILLSPFFAVVGSLALYASWELRLDVAHRWHGSSTASRVSSLLYCFKQCRNQSYF